VWIGNSLCLLTQLLSNIRERKRDEDDDEKDRRRWPDVHDRDTSEHIGLNSSRVSLSRMEGDNDVLNICVLSCVLSCHRRHRRERKLVNRS
jgi:hypothetical protein